MSSFSCPHFMMDGERCQRLRAECVPGRPGCVLCGNSKFAVPWEERLRLRQQQQQQRSPGGDRPSDSR